ncbi:PTS glucose transporter subunit IIA [Clostridiaceae bacterium AF42-6]|nr:PTS glucose transporter subunit IIA [Clostridiaceae bacterium AF42-6]RHQ22084.1 PTS glucose transporter subunit IIA [Clostridiaceae bacterium AF29-16BH]
MKDQIFGVLQRVGRSFMLPIAVLPVAGLLLGIGSSFTNATMIDTYGLQAILGEGTILNMFLTVLSKAGSALFDNLPIIFAVGCAIGMAKKEKEVAALSAVIAYFTMNAAVNAMLVNSGQILDDGSIADFVLQGTITSSVGIQTLQMGVFGGIIVGLGVAALHNRFYTIELPSALAFFSGSRFVPIISTVVYVLVGIGMFFVWPVVQNGIYALGGLVTGTGYLGTLIFGIIKRALIPFGLHHVFYLPFWQTGVGGSMEVAGKMIEGGQNIFFAQLADPSTVHFSADACRYFSGEFIFMIFGLPGAALAMYQTAKPEKKKQAGGLLLSAALACMATGITEPLEFSFLFVAPMLFAVQVILAGAAYMIAHILNIAVGLTFSGGLLDLFLFGILQGNAKTSWLRIIPVGIIYFLLYYGIFKFLILKFDLKTPGREDEDTETRLYTKADYNAAKESGVKGAEVSALITAGLGGKANIEDVDCCATRLRCTIKDPEKVQEALLKQSGSRGVILKGKGIQVIYGPQVAVLKTNLEAFLQTSAADQVSSQVSSGEEIKSPMNGTVIPLSEVPDAVFSSEMLGKGFGVEPSEGKAYAPVDGEVTTVFDTKHAIGLMSKHGVELLIHIGMDTVKLNGKGFDVKVKTGDQVKAGDLLAEFDMDLIKGEGYPVTTAVVVTNTDDCEEIGEVRTGAATKDTEVLTVKA